MASKEDCSDLQNIKAIIRSLLIVDRRPLTLPQFLSEFKRSEGQELPFRQHGFGDPLDFLLSLPDTVRLTRVGDEAGFYVRPTLTKEVQHIRNLVNGQKSKPLVFKPSMPVKGSKQVEQTQDLVSCKKKSEPLESHPPATSKSVDSLKQVQHAQNLVNGQKDSKPLVSQPPTNSKPANSASRPWPVLQAHAGPKQPPNSQPPVVPEKIKDNLCQLLADHFASGIDVLQLDEAYARKFGSGIDYPVFGYETIEDFVLSMRGILCATRSSAGVMRVFANFRDFCQPPAKGTLPHLLQTWSSTVSTYPCSQRHPKPQPVLSVVTSLDTIDLI